MCLCKMQGQYSMCIYLFECYISMMIAETVISIDKYRVLYGVRHLVMNNGDKVRAIATGNGVCEGTFIYGGNRKNCLRDVVTETIQLLIVFVLHNLVITESSVGTIGV